MKALMSSLSGVVAAYALLAVVALGARAAPITFVIDGTVDSVSAPLAGEFSVGEAFQLRYTFESTAAPLGPGVGGGRPAWRHPVSHYAVVGFNRNLYGNCSGCHNNGWR